MQFFNIKNKVGVAPYGGGLWRTWFDRDLSIAGQVVFCDDQGNIIHKLVNLIRPIMHIPNLVIYFIKFTHPKLSRPFIWNPNEANLNSIMNSISVQFWLTFAVLMIAKRRRRKLKQHRMMSKKQNINKIAAFSMNTIKYF